MRLTSVILCAALSSTSLSARVIVPRHLIKSEIATSAVTQPVDASIIATLFDQAAHARAQTVGDNRSARYFIIPAAGSVAGANGTFFRSDVTLINYASTSEDVIAVWWANGTTTAPTVANGTRITLAPAKAVTYVDFVASVLGKSGLGSILFFGVQGSTLDTNAAIDGLSRIYTKQPGSDGTVSQEFPPVDVFNLLVADTSASLGLRQDASYRTNFGIVNAEAVPHTVTVTAVGERATNSVTVTVPAYGMVQQAIPPGDYGALTVAFDITDSGGASISWVAYASSTDNITGDGWVSIASADLTPDDLTIIGYGKK
jgi:hypothetical protein